MRNVPPPTPEEIAARSAALRESWTPAERVRRANGEIGGRNSRRICLRQSGRVLRKSSTLDRTSDGW